MEVEGIKTACLYSYGCQQVKKMKIGKELLGFFKEKKPTQKECKFIVEILKKLQSYRGYSLIRDLRGSKSPFDPKVVKAYWLGDERNENFTHNFVTLAKFREVNCDEHLPDWIVNSMFDCAISFAKIIEVDSKKPKALEYRLLYRTGRVFWGQETREVDRGFVDNLKKGDLVSIHWGIVREKISQKQAKTLQNITLQAIKRLQIA